MATILITGGQERENGYELGEGKYYKAAKLLKLDTDSSELSQLAIMNEGSENYPEEHPNLEFTIGSVKDDKLFIPTDTEVHIYQYPTISLVKKISYPFFHNIHHVQAFDNYIAVVSTGLDMVVLLSPDTFEPIEFLNVEGKDPWHRFSPDVDYRKVHSTRPHEGHPNYVFHLNDELWVTRCTQEDAVCLSDVSKRIDISREKSISVHDGHLHNGYLYFTTVDGFVVIADPQSRKVVDEVNLNDFEPNGLVKGWCRGIMLDGDRIYVGFSKLRQTKNKSKLDWLRKMSGKKVIQNTASVAVYDLKKRVKLNEWFLPEGSIDAIYGILATPENNTRR